MCVVEQGLESVLFLECEHLVGDRRVIPFVDENQVYFLELFLQEAFQGRVVLVEVDIELGVDPPKVVDGFNRGLTFLANEIGKRPCAQLLVRANLMAKTNQCARQSAQEVRVAMVPVRYERVCEDPNSQLAVQAAATSEWTRER